ncbi:hypothetical protein K0T92_02865 [Paenibacillus oenotherae]|uniref:DUF4190 domain-containing protein n=1 Tax=Paenibacillus oenotherae TaxID=1435645 RepID=A0ABS7D193_9BACL|nr:hypothetical protein [Paenibacillus oenotherae]MBW7473684.1 hypothetical protein [Paenibacillus oenotherae]
MGNHSSSHDNRKAKRSRKLDKTHQDEMAAELAVPGLMGDTSASDEGARREYARKATRSAGVAVGWAGLIIAALSWFVWPVLLGITAAVLGFIAFRQGSRGLGTWSITLGLIAAAAYLILIPLYYALT